jgi:Lrp/AsnC family transcriptional regulator, regulator for asnA, asnC and gidA
MKKREETTLEKRSITIDDFDLELIKQLQKDGKKSYVSLGETIGAVEGTVRKRIKTLLKKDIIKIVAIPNLRQLGYRCISITGFQTNMKELEQVVNDLVKMPNICYLAHVAGRYDLIGFIVTRSPEELSGFLKQKMSEIPGIQKTETFVNLEIVKGAGPAFETIQLMSSYGTSLVGNNPGAREKGLSYSGRGFADNSSSNPSSRSNSKHSRKSR